jgi:hypothetical protein
MLVNQYNQKYDSQKMILRHIQSWLYIYFSIKESFYSLNMRDGSIIVILWTKLTNRIHIQEPT